MTAGGKMKNHKGEKEKRRKKEGKRGKRVERGKKEGRRKRAVGEKNETLGGCRYKDYGQKGDKKQSIEKVHFPGI